MHRFGVLGLLYGDQVVWVLHWVEVVQRAWNVALLKLRIKRLKELVTWSREMKRLADLGFLGLEIRDWCWVYC